ncbi:MAG TPA: DUF4198 domain-containing protein [Candidatus Hydrogenedentes bacterium]|nr:DUF4198 domain-containing protein [Candidatus Hydrogenedentota bacterium]
MLMFSICAVVSLDALAHFQVLIPSTDMVTDPKHNRVDLTIQFTHPMEGGPVMAMDTPKQFGVFVGNARRDLLSLLSPVVVDGKSAFTATYLVEEPGGHLFYIEPAPYWEAGENTYIKHYTKVLVGGFNSWSGWNKSVGFPVEIRPLARPLGLWTGNIFRGVVEANGKPVPDINVEVEFYNEPKQVTAPNDAFITQTMKTDANGVFAYGLPRAGWWGFAALVDGIETLPGPDGKPADVESGALMWVRAVDMK